MISWIQRTFQHHFRAVFAVLLAVTIVSFIATIGAAPGIGNGERRTTEQEFYGHNLASAADVGAIVADANFSLALASPDGVNRRDADTTREYGLQRVAALHLAQEWHLPPVAPDSAEMVEFIKHVPLFVGENGQFDPQKYAQTRTMLRSGGRSGEADVARILADDLQIQKVEMLLGGPGYILPDDVRSDLAREDATWTLATATIDYAGFKGKAAPTDADLNKYFTANASRYTIPAQVVVTYVDFPAEQYLPRVQVTEAEVRAYYDRDPSRFPKPAPAAAAKGAKAPEIKVDAAADFASVRPKVQSELKLERARGLAAKDASDFSYSLYQNKVAAGPALDAFLQSRHVAARTLPPFAADQPPAALGGSPDIASAAFALTAERYYSEAMPTSNGAVVLLWKGNQPPRQPALAEVRGRVVADWAADQKRTEFTAAGNKLKSDIAARMKQGTTFEKAAAAAGAASGLKVTVKALPAFKLSDRPKDLSPVVLQGLENLKPGQLSDIDLNGDEGVLVYAVARKDADLGNTSPRFAEVRSREGMYFARMTASGALNELVARQLERTAPRAE